MAEETLFPGYDESVGQKTIVFYQPKKDNFDSAVSKLDTHIGTPELKRWAKDVLPMLKKNPFKVQPLNDRTEEPLLRSYMESPTKVRKTDLLRFVAFFISDERNFAEYLQRLPDNGKALWTAALRRLYISNDLFREITGEDFITENSWSYMPSLKMGVMPAFFVAEQTRTFNKRDGYNAWTYCITPFDRALQAAHKYLDSIDTPTVRTSDTLPKEDELLSLTGTEQEFAETIDVLLGMAAQGVLKLGKTGKLLATVKKKVTQQVTLREFYADQPDDTYNSLRSTSLFFSIASFAQSHKMMKFAPKDYSETCKKLYADVSKNMEDYFCMLLPHIGGITNGYDTQSYCREAMEFLEVVLGQNAKDWANVDDLVAVLERSVGGSGATNLIDSYNYSSRHISNKKTDQHINIIDLHYEVFVPFVKALLFLMASLGLADVAYRKPKAEDSSYVDGLRYVRLTPLGLYVLDITEKYEPIRIEKKTYFELDANKLILKSTEADNPYVGIVESMAESIGGGRYTITPESFLRGCATEKDVKDKASLFRQFVSKDIPPVWEDFFKSVDDKCKPLTPIVSTLYKIYEVSPNNKPLLHLLSTDETLRKLVRRAEGFLILVEQSDLSKFEARLKTFGYLI